MIALIAPVPAAALSFVAPGAQIVETDFRQAYGALIAAIQHMPTERVSDALVQQAIANETWEHYAQHRSDIEKWRKQLILRYPKISLDG